MCGRGLRGVVLVAVAAFLGCGGARPLDPSTGTGGSAAGAPGRAGASGGSSPIGDPIGPTDPVTPQPRGCGCTPGAGIDLLECGSDWLPNTLRDAPEAIVTPDGATVIFNLCLAETGGGCTPGMFRWKSGEGTRVVTERAWAFAVSADGARALGVRTDGDGPFIAQADGTTVELSLGRSYAHLLSADGAVVVARVEYSPSLTMAVRWTTPTDLTTLGDLAGGPDYSEPIAINADASVIVGYGNTARGQEPFLWTRAGGMVGLGTLPSQTVQTVARATSEDGSVVVGSNLTDGGTAIFRWTASGGMAALGIMFDNVPARGSESYFTWWSPPLLVSADGAVVTGTAVQASNPTVPLAFRWTASGGREPLSSAPASIVRAISADGRRIVGSTLASGAPPALPFEPLPYQGFLFEEGRGTRPLADVLAGVDLAGMTFGDPIALSADGRFLVGHASCAGAPAIFRAALPR